jgi:hypothetical protein
MECGIWYEISSNGISESAERKKKGSARWGLKNQDAVGIKQWKYIKVVNCQRLLELFVFDKQMRWRATKNKKRKPKKKNIHFLPRLWLLLAPHFSLIIPVALANEYSRPMDLSSVGRW